MGIKKASASDILGGTSLKREPSPEQTDCFVCNKAIPVERIAALKSLGSPSGRWTHAKCSVTTKIKGVYTGEVGTSKMLLVDKLYDDSVRSVFRKTEAEDNPPAETEEETED